MERIKVIKSSCFTSVDNGFIKNKNLSLKAKGLLLILLSLHEEFSITIRYLTDHCCPDGKAAVAATLKELKINNHLQTKQIRQNGKMAGIEYIVYEKRQDGEQNTENQASRKPKAENRVTVEIPEAELPFPGNQVPENQTAINNYNTKDYLEKTENNKKEKSVQDIFSFYKNQFSSLTSPRPLAKWFNLISSRLKIYTENELNQAILNARNNRFLCGENDKEEFYATIEYIFRNDAQIDKLLAQKATKNPNYDTKDFNQVETIEFVEILKVVFGKYNIGQAMNELDKKGENSKDKNLIYRWHKENKERVN